MKRWRGLIIITAVSPDIRAARGVIGKSIRKTLGVRRWGEPPYWVGYTSSKARMGETGVSGLQPLFELNATEEEWDSLMGEIKKESYTEGWDHSPIDPYYDMETYTDSKSDEIVIKNLEQGLY